MTSPPDRFTLHISVPIRWWLNDLANASEAERFLYDKLPSGRVSLVALERLEFQVLRELVRNLGELYPNPYISGLLFNDVSRAFRKMAQQGFMRLANEQAISRSAFLLANYYNIPFEDALAATLAEDTGYPLLLADEQTYQALKTIEKQRQRFRMVWLPDYC